MRGFCSSHVVPSKDLVSSRERILEFNSGHQKNICSIYIFLENKMAEGFLTWLLDVVSGYASDIAIHIMVLIYAPYKSIKAIRSPDEEDDKQWLTFW
jgi:hypothetical protein